MRLNLVVTAVVVVVTPVVEIEDPCGCGYSSLSCVNLDGRNKNEEETGENRDGRFYSTSAPASTNCLLGNFEVSRSRFRAPAPSTQQGRDFPQYESVRSINSPLKLCCLCGVGVAVERASRAVGRRGRVQRRDRCFRRLLPEARDASGDGLLLQPVRRQRALPIPREFSVSVTQRQPHTYQHSISGTHPVRKIAQRPCVFNACCFCFALVWCT